MNVEKNERPVKLDFVLRIGVNIKNILLVIKKFFQAAGRRKRGIAPGSKRDTASSIARPG